MGVGVSCACERWSGRRTCARTADVASARLARGAKGVAVGRASLSIVAGGMGEGKGEGGAGAIYISVNGAEEWKSGPSVGNQPRINKSRHNTFTRLSLCGGRRPGDVYCVFSTMLHSHTPLCTTANASGQLHNHRPSWAAAHPPRHARRPAEMQAARNNRPRSTGTQ